MPIIDAHAHIYPERIAAKAVSAVGRFYGMERAMTGKGSPADLLERGRDAGITRFVVHSVATTPHAVTTINDFIAGQCAEHPEFIGFATMHPDFEDMELAMGLRGFKLHPDTQEVNMDDERLMRFYEIIAGRVPLVVHTGDYRHDFSHPRGGWSVFDVAFDVLHEDLLREERLFVDASSSLAWVGRRHMRELVRLWGADRVMFGSDYPMWDPGLELEEMRACGLSEDELERVLWRNAVAFTGVEP